MSRLVIESPQPSSTNGAVETAAQLHGAAHYRMRFRASAGGEQGVVDPFLTAAFIPAMAMGATIEVRAPVSAGLLRHLSTAQDILTTWDERLHRIAVEAEPAPPALRSPGVAAFFSGGVDSFYTVLRHLDELTHLVFVHGFDVSLRDDSLRGRIATSLRAAATELGLPLIEVATNARGLADRHLDWTERYHGSALASVAQLLADKVGRIYLPATFTYDQLEPFGSHPLLDPLWGTDALEIVHDGAEATRLQKVELIATNDVALRWLRVCWQNNEGAYNCGHCEKCVRTMATLAAVGALERCASFAMPLQPGPIRETDLRDPRLKRMYRENLDRLVARGYDPQILAAMRSALRPHPARYLTSDARALGRRGAARLRRTLRPKLLPSGPVSLAHFTFEDSDG